MDAKNFDDVTRNLISGDSRRTFLAGTPPTEAVSSQPLLRGASAGVSRRGSLATLAGAAIAATMISDPRRVHAGKDARKARKRKKKKCKRQIDQCRSVVTDSCASTPTCPPELLSEILACCEHFNDCKADEALDCLFTPRVVGGA